VTTIYPELRSALVAAAQHHYQAPESTPVRLAGGIERRPLGSLALGAAACGLAAVAAALLVSAGGAATAAQAFPLLKTPASPLSAHPALAKQLRGASAAGIPSFRSVHTFSGAGYTGGVSQVKVGGTSMLCVAFASTGGTSARVGCSATSEAERQGITLTDGGRFVVLVPTGGSVDLVSNGRSTPLATDGSGIASGLVDHPASLTVHVGGATTTTQLPGAQRVPDRRQAT
jgi:hypothetical protein